MAFSVNVQFPRDIAARLHRRLENTGSWKLLREQERAKARVAKKNRENFEHVRPLPSREVVRQLMDVAFAASVMEEEGRRITFTLGYLNPEGASRLNFRVLRFKRPVMLRPSDIAKVALSTVAARTTLGVWPSAAGELAIWGFIHHGSQTFGIDLEHRPTYFSLRVLRPGTFTVQFDEHLVLLFSRDHSHIFEKRLDLLATLRDRAGVAPVVAQALVRLARRMLAHGHGGTILVRDKDVTPRGLKMHKSYAVARGVDGILKDALKRHEDAMTGQRPKGMNDGQFFRYRIDSESAHDEALDFVAQLTAVDGAVLLDNELGLHGFGTTITTTDKAPKEVILEDPRTPNVETRIDLGKLGGNRHRSAVCFCSTQRTLALALVASQDGDLSLVARRNDKLVHVIKPFELGVGI